MGNPTKHYLISGRVQGVGFRAHTQRWGLKLKLLGWVRNLSDGRVEALARGSAGALLQFERHLRQGPARASVISLEITDWDGHEELPEFEVRKDGI